MDAETLQLRRELLLTQARLKALEAFVADGISPEERERWYRGLDQLTARLHQEQLEAAEDQSPGLGASLDDRSPDELGLL